MITYPPDIHFSQFESEIPADQLMRLLRRQVHWAMQEGDKIKREIDGLERMKNEEWVRKEVLLEGLMEAEIMAGMERGVLDDEVVGEMERDVETAKGLTWTEEPWWKAARPNGHAGLKRRAFANGHDEDIRDASEDGEAIIDDELADRQGQTSRALDQAEVDEDRARTEKDNDMMAVGALMGLSAAT